MKKQLRPTITATAPCILLAMLILAPSGASSAVLGEPSSISSIGEPLRIEIPVRNGDISRAAECLRIVSAPPHDGLTWIREGRITTLGRGASARIVITHPAPSYEPALKLGIDDICDSRLRREYTLLLAFPTEIAPLEPVASRNSTRNDELPAAATTSDAPRRPRSAPLRNSRAATAPPQSPAPQLTPRATASPATPTSTPAPAAQQDRLVVAGGSDEMPATRLRLSTELTSAGRIGATSDSRRDELRREQSAIMALDRTIVAQLELTERIRQLEEVQAKLLARAQHEGTVPIPAEAETPGRSAAPATSRPVVEAVTRSADTGNWIYTATTIAGLALGLAALLLRMRQRRIESGTEQAFKLEPRTTAARKTIPKTGLRADEHELADSEPAPLTSSLPSAAPITQPEHTPLGWEMAESAFAAPIAPIASFSTFEEEAEEHESAIELAEIMMGFGRIQGAAETLAEFIASNPKRAVTPWLKLLEVYRAADLRQEFDVLAQQLNKTFNVKSVTWDTFDEARQSTQTMEQMAHVTKKVQRLWGTTECQAYLEELLRDNRDGTREGFPLSVIDEILVLAAILEEEIGPYRPAPESALVLPKDEPATSPHLA